MEIMVLTNPVEPMGLISKPEHIKSTGKTKFYKKYVTKT